MKKKIQYKIDWKKLFLKATEEDIKKCIELLILAIILGVSMRILAVSIPAIMVGSFVSKLTKVKLLE